MEFNNTSTIDENWIWRITNVSLYFCETTWSWKTKRTEKKQQVRSVDDCLLGSPRTGSTGVREAQGLMRGHRFDDFLDLGIYYQNIPKRCEKTRLMVSKWEDYLQWCLKARCMMFWTLAPWDIIWRANQGSLDDRDLSWPFWSWWIELLSRGLWWESMILFLQMFLHIGESCRWTR